MFGLRWRWRLRVGRSWGIGGDDGATAARWMGDRVAVVTGRSDRVSGATRPNTLVFRSRRYSATFDHMQGQMRAAEGA